MYIKVVNVIKYHSGVCSMVSRLFHALPVALESWASHIYMQSHATMFCLLMTLVLGPISLTVFPSQFKFDGNFVLLSSKFQYSDRYKILYMARQLCCRGMCKNLLRSDGQQRNYSKAKFSSNVNCGQKIVSETGPWSINSIHCDRHIMIDTF